MSDAKLTSVGKPKIGGAIYRAPLGTTLPTDATTPLDGAFKGLGYCGKEGLVNANETETEDIKAWGGDVILSSPTSKKDTFKFKLIEVLNAEVLKAVYGDNNVSGTLESGIVVKANSEPQVACEWVVELILNGGAVKRIVVPSAAVTSVGEIVYKDDEEVGYETTILATADTEGQTHYEYIKRQAGTMQVQAAPAKLTKGK